MENEQSNPVALGAKTYPDADRMIIGFYQGYLREYSFKLGKTLHDYGKVFKCDVTSIAKTVDNKSIFVCFGHGRFKEFDISSHNEVNNFKVEEAHYCLVT